MLRGIALCILALSSAPIARAQQQPAPLRSTTRRPIQDNSFLIEEAYNQEPGVIQHISFFTRSWKTKNWLYTFTEEIPIGSQKHQFSVTLPALSANAESIFRSGLGDIALNYRYQLVGNGDSRVAIAPRFSVQLPTGATRNRLGAGTVGIQLNVPVSLALSDHVVTHSNAGLIYLPSARNDREEKATVKIFNLGQSAVWLAHPRFNVMLEAVWYRTDSIIRQNFTRSSDAVFLSPGIRWSHDLEKVQIVPGIAFPIGVGPSRGDRGIIFYLSFEHSFRGH